jgi:hypothetical protein
MTMDSKQELELLSALADNELPAVLGPWLLNSMNRDVRLQSRFRHLERIRKLVRLHGRRYDAPTRLRRRIGSARRVAARRDLARRLRLLWRRWCMPHANR